MKMLAKKGDLITMAKNGEFDVIVHGQNCIHGWKAGIAKDIARNFPSAKKADLATINADKKKLGTYSSAKVTLECGKELVVINAYTQFKFGKGLQLNYRALKDVFNAINNDFKDKTIAYPKIGAGHAGGDWKKIISIIDEELINVNHTLVIL